MPLLVVLLRDLHCIVTSWSLSYNSELNSNIRAMIVSCSWISAQFVQELVDLQVFYAQKEPFTKQIATEGFSTVFGQLMSPL